VDPYLNESKPIQKRDQIIVELNESPEKYSVEKDVSQTMSNSRQPNLFKLKSDSVAADQKCKRSTFIDDAPTEIKLKK
jgi:hypothetical protein